MVLNSFRGQSVPEFMIVLIGALLLFSSAFFMITNQGHTDEETFAASQLMLSGHTLANVLQSNAYLPPNHPQVVVIAVPTVLQLQIQQNRLTLTTSKGGYYSERINVHVQDIEITDWNGSLIITNTANGVTVHE